MPNYSVTGSAPNRGSRTDSTHRSLTVRRRGFQSILWRIHPWPPCPSSSPSSQPSPSPPPSSGPNGKASRVRATRQKSAFSNTGQPGPRLIYTADNPGVGYGSVAVTGNRIYLQGATKDSSQVIALNRGPGLRGTPAVDGDRLYVLTENGDLAGLKTDGKILWQRNILKDFGGAQLQWLLGEAPLVDGAHVVVTPGGPGAGVAKLDKMTNKTVRLPRPKSTSPRK